MEDLECPLCGGPLIPLGILGRLLHTRCRNCGMSCTREVPEPDEDEDDDYEEELEELISDACEAEETFGVDELERLKGAF